MANNLAWSAGAGVGYTWTSCFQTGDLASLASGSAVMSSTGDITNQTAQDLYADFVFELTISSSTLAIGAACSLFLFDKWSVDGTNTYYGDNSFGSAGGTQHTYYPANSLAATWSATITGSAQTVVGVFFSQVQIKPSTFRPVFGQSLGVALTSGTQYGYYRTYRLQTND